MSANCKEKLLNYDVFGASLALNFPGGQATHRSTTGACLNILVLLVTWVYLAQ